jgi:hypothetical protein
VWNGVNPQSASKCVGRWVGRAAQRVNTNIKVHHVTIQSTENRKYFWAIIHDVKLSTYEYAEITY